MNVQIIISFEFTLLTILANGQFIQEADKQNSGLRIPESIPFPVGSQPLDLNTNRANIVPPTNLGRRADIPEMATLQPIRKSPESLDGIVDLMKTFTGNTSIDGESIKRHLIQKTSEHAKEDALDIRNSILQSRRQDQIAQFKKEDNESNTVPGGQSSNSTQPLILPTEASTEAKFFSTRPTEGTTKAENYVDEILNNHELLQKLLEKLIEKELTYVQNVSTNDQ